jgi:hypothetical protein
MILCCIITDLTVDFLYKPHKPYIILHTNGKQPILTKTT